MDARVGGTVVRGGARGVSCVEVTPRGFLAPLPREGRLFGSLRVYDPVGPQNLRCPLKSDPNTYRSIPGRRFRSTASRFSPRALPCRLQDSPCCYLSSFPSSPFPCFFPSASPKKPSSNEFLPLSILGNARIFSRRGRHSYPILEIT